MKSVTITPKKLSGKVVLPPSKSLCHRAIICAALAKGRSVIENVGYSDDIRATMDAMRAMGAEIREDGSTLTIDGSRTLTQSGIIDCAESGSTLRFLIPFALLIDQPTTFIGRGRLPQRPLNTYYNLFDSCGITYENADGQLPLTVQKGELSPVISVEGNVSSQFITGLLFVLPLFPHDTEIKITTPMESKGYLDLTLDMLARFGISITHSHYRRFHIPGGQAYKPARYRVEGDFSHAAFFLAAGTLGSFTVCRGLYPESLQGDRGILKVIEKMGGKLVIEEDGVSAIPGKLRGCRIDVSQIPDLVPAIAVMAALAEGETVITNAERLRIKESDRLSAMAEQLNILGATIIEKKDGLVIEGVSRLSGGTVNSMNDHRIAMALAIASTCADDVVVIEDSGCVSKSYPHFWKDFESLGGQIDEWDVG